MNSLNKLADILHLLLCQHVHEYEITRVSDRKDNVCYYYPEEDIAEGLNMPDHQEWLRIAENFVIALDFDSVEKAIEFVREVIELSRHFNSLRSNSNRNDFIKSILF